MQTVKVDVSYAEFHEKSIESGLRAGDHAFFKLKVILHNIASYFFNAPNTRALNFHNKTVLRQKLILGANLSLPKL